MLSFENAKMPPPTVRIEQKEQNEEVWTLQ